MATGEGCELRLFHQNIPDILRVLFPDRFFPNIPDISIVVIYKCPGYFGRTVSKINIRDILEKWSGEPFFQKHPGFFGKTGPD